jgi:DNA-binding IclR family transcriptional regulator
LYGGQKQLYMTPNEENGRKNRIKAAENVFNIVEALEQLDGATMSELANHLDMPKSTAHVYLKTLQDAGYAVKEDTTYRLSLRFLKHGGYTRHGLDLYQAAKTQINELSNETGEVVDIGVEENGKRVLIYKSEGPEGVTQKPVTGEYTHMHMTAIGKALLATLSDERVDEVIETHGLPPATQHTITDRGELFEELETIRNQEYSVENQERREGIRAIAVPIRDDNGHAIGAVSISGPISKLTDDRISNELLDQIRNAVNIIEIRHKNY